MKRQIILAAALSAAASFCFGQASVEDRYIGLSSASSTSRTTASGTGAVTGELYYQLQILQQEVLELRGLVEEQSFQLKKLKQQNLDDYVDLDRRLGRLESGGAGPTGAGSPAVSPANSAVASVNSPQPAQDEFKRYKDAYRQATQDPSQAETALKSFIQDFPESKFVANSLFVLGELKLKAGDLEDARAWFMRVLIEHPEHYRAANAKLKLGKVFQLQGDMEQAKKYWTEAANSGSNVAGQAQDNLRTYFPN